MNARRYPKGLNASLNNARSTTMLICTLLTFALCADPNVPAAIAIGDMTVPVVWTRQQTRSCMQLGAQDAGGPGDAQMEFTFGTRGAVKIAQARIAMTSYSWPKMTAYDRGSLRQQYRATLWHEIGHLVTARTSIATALANDVKPSDAFNQIDADQNAYDDLTEHGIRQDRAAPPLDGADTIVECR